MPPPGMIARSISVSPSCASSAAILMSQASANSSPPPSAKPRMAAMIAWGQGCLAVYDEVISYCWREGFHSASSSGRSTRSEARRPRRGHFCAVTNSELSVGPTGELLVRHAIPNSGYRALDAAAAASGMPIPLALQQRTDDRVDECSGCEVEGLCGGGCTAQSARHRQRARQSRARLLHARARETALGGHWRGGAAARQHGVHLPKVLHPSRRYRRARRAVTHGGTDPGRHVPLSSLRRARRRGPAIS